MNAEKHARRLHAQRGLMSDLRAQAETWIARAEWISWAGLHCEHTDRHDYCAWIVGMDRRPGMAHAWKEEGWHRSRRH